MYDSVSELGCRGQGPPMGLGDLGTYLIMYK